MRADVIREKFLKFFQSQGHKVVSSDSLVPKDDPTLLFTGAGMNQFKDYFLGIKKDLKCAASSQKCLRTADIDNVGKTPGHHTFFEMLGNFSFGFYFKKEAIQWAWEFMTRELGIDKKLLWVSVYKDDLEAYEIWRKIVQIDKARLMKLGDKDNFWPSEAKTKGPNGPCGPCSEIFFDQGAKIGCGKPDCSPACDCDRFVEVWNLVFTQYNRKGLGILEPLPMKNIDTGMGLERIAAVMQGVHSNFQTDLFEPIVKAALSLCHPKERSDISKVYTIADHVRAAVFLIADGVLPSNEGRGYVERMIIRRAARFARQLGIQGAFLYKLVVQVTTMMKKPYPYLALRRENIAQILLAEEEKFAQTLESGLEILEGLMSKNNSKRIKAEDVFRLYDTYGFPVDLTEQIAREKGFNIDKEGFKKAMDAQRRLSRKSSGIAGEIFAKTLTQKITALSKPTEFLGYDKFSSEAQIAAILKDELPVQSAKENETILVMLDKTPFYGESGGQIGDTGRICASDGKKSVLEVADTKRFDKVIAHVCKVKSGFVNVGDTVIAEIDKARRQDIARNHTATHLLQAALRKVLGEHVRQSGSLVRPDRLRFDFTHFKALSPEQLERIEKLVNDNIKKDDAIDIKTMKLSHAVSDGVIALFNEKYEDTVRGVYINDSKELCGGTHVERTSQIGMFKIISEGSVSAGARRIEAATGDFAVGIIRQEQKALKAAADLLGVCEKAALEKLQEYKIRLQRTGASLEKFKKRMSMADIDEIISKGKDIKGIKTVICDIEDSDMDTLRSMADIIRTKAGTVAILLASQIKDDKVNLVVSFSHDLVKDGFNAGAIIKDVAKLIGGSGGGRPDLAQAGGKEPAGLKEAFKKFKELLEKR